MNLAQAQNEPVKFIPFNAFIQKVKEADANDFLSRPASKVRDAAAFDEMRRYILSLYRGVHVAHSYVLGSQSVDCVPVNEQPSVRALNKGKIASEPPSPPQQIATKADSSGNQTRCEANTIPMRRITLEQLSRFRTLQDFLKKTPK